MQSASVGSKAIASSSRRSTDRRRRRSRETRPGAGRQHGERRAEGPSALLGSGRMRIAVLSDVHANLVALEAALAAAGQVDAIWQLGDIVGYGPEPDAVVARLREAGARGVRGNHDAAACGGSEIDWFNPDARRAMEWTRRAISDESVAWLRTLPDRATMEGCELVHGSPREPLWE